MKPARSREIISNQIGVHEKLFATLDKHLQNVYQKPVARYNLHAFTQAAELVEAAGKPLIFDSGCGTGESTRFLAKKYPSHFVLGIDKSQLRIEKALADETDSGENIAFVRADIFDFWRQALAASWQVDKHYLLYPNPWPKKKYLQRRYHGHPVFPVLLKLGSYFEIRSNWEIYLQEFAAAVKYVCGVEAAINGFHPVHYLTNFEKKYHSSGHTLYKSCFSIHKD
ncbi:MAG: methyltransferase domain-containing protein [Calditrichaeota bacterium]|nr:MAG: methyltransferase domain-containing protein [Calditrichota bacterium]